MYISWKWIGNIEWRYVISDKGYWVDTADSYLSSLIFLKRTK